MEWHYAVDGQQRGPVSDDQLRELAQQGVVTGQTLVWHAGLANWQPFSTVVTSLSVLPPGQAQCTECGRTLPESEMIRYGSLWICAQCKPVFLQRLQEGANLPGQGVWRAGKRLVMQKGAELPPRCVKCNAPSDGPGLKRTLYWYHPALYLLLLLGCLLQIGFLLFIIVVLLTRKKAATVIGLCARHRQGRWRAIIVSWSLIAAGLALAIASGVWGNELGDATVYVAIGGIGLTIGAIFYGVIMGRMIYAYRIDNEVAWISGVCRPYLDALPEWPGK